MNFSSSRLGQSFERDSGVIDQVAGRNDAQIMKRALSLAGNGLMLPLVHNKHNRRYAADIQSRNDEMGDNSVSNEVFPVNSAKDDNDDDDKDRKELTSLDVFKRSGDALEEGKNMFRYELLHGFDMTREQLKVVRDRIMEIRRTCDQIEEIMENHDMDHSPMSMTGPLASSPIFQSQGRKRDRESMVMMDEDEEEEEEETDDEPYIDVGPATKRFRFPGGAKEGWECDSSPYPHAKGVFPLSHDSGLRDVPTLPNVEAKIWEPQRLEDSFSTKQLEKYRKFAEDLCAQGAGEHAVRKPLAVLQFYNNAVPSICDLTPSGRSVFVQPTKLVEYVFMHMRKNKPMKEEWVAINRIMKRKFSRDFWKGTNGLGFKTFLIKYDCFEILDQLVMMKEVAADDLLNIVRASFPGDAMKEEKVVRIMQRRKALMNMLGK